MNAHPATFAFVQIQHGDEYATPWGNARANFYTDFSGYPTSYFDGTIARAGPWPSSTYESDYNVRRSTPTDVTITLLGTELNPPAYRVTATVAVAPDGAAKTMRIYFVQVLDHWPPTISYARNGFKQAAATQDVTLGPGQSEVMQRDFTFDSDSLWSHSNIKIIAWAQEPQSTSPPSNRAEVYQAAILPFSAFMADCNNNGVPDPQDIAAGDSTDCNNNGIPDECELSDNPVLIKQDMGENFVNAQSLDDDGFPTFSTKQWDDFTAWSDVLLGTGRATFAPPGWTGYGVIPFLVEVATAPGGAEAGATVVASTTGVGAAGIVSWNFNGAPLPEGTYWLSVQAVGGFIDHGMVYWMRANEGQPHGSEHYFHNPGGGWGKGPAPLPYSQWPAAPADLAFTQHLVRLADCNANGTLDDCDILSGPSEDENNNGVPDECEAPPVCRGDSNCDGGVNWRDIDFFVAAMTSEAAWRNVFLPVAPGCPYDNNDVSGDGSVNWRDIDPLVALMNTACP